MKALASHVLELYASHKWPKHALHVKQRTGNIWPRLFFGTRARILMRVWSKPARKNVWPLPKREPMGDPSVRGVACLGGQQLRDLADRPDVTVMQTEYCNQFQPWSAREVNVCMDHMIALTRQCNGDKAEIQRRVDAQPRLAEFCSKYSVFSDKLTDMAFINDAKHLATVRKIVALKGRMETGELDEKSARDACSEIALGSLMGRIADADKPNSA